MKSGRPPGSARGAAERGRKSPSRGRKNHPAAEKSSAGAKSHPGTEKLARGGKSHPGAEKTNIMAKVLNLPARGPAGGYPVRTLFDLRPRGRLFSAGYFRRETASATRADGSAGRRPDIGNVARRAIFDGRPQAPPGRTGSAGRRPDIGNVARRAIFGGRPQAPPGRTGSAGRRPDVGNVARRAIFDERP